MMCTKIIEFTDEKLKPKVQIEDEFIYIMNESVRPHFLFFVIIFSQICEKT